MEQTNEPVKVETIAPPTWEDVMNEKKSELQNMQTNHHKTGKESSDFIQLEKLEIDKETAKEEEEAIKIENDEKLTCIQNFLATLQRIIKILKAIAMWCTLMSDVVLWMSSLAVLIACCLIVKRYFDVSRVVYRQEFQKGGEAFLAFSCINLVICCPLGILGTYKKRRRLLKWHNVILFTNGLLHTIAAAVLFLRYLKKDRKHRLESVYLKTMRDTYKYCEVKQLNKTEECCCWLKTTGKRIICSPFLNPIDESIGPRGSSCTDKEDYFDRSDTAINIVFHLLLLFVLIEMSTCVCGIIQSLLLKSEESEEKKRKKRRKPPKGRVAKLYRKAKYMACKKILIAIFGIVLVISWPLFNLWYKGFVIKIDKIEVNIIDLIAYQYNNMMKN